MITKESILEKTAKTRDFWRNIARREGDRQPPFTLHDKDFNNGEPLVYKDYAETKAREFDVIISRLREYLV